MRRRTFPSILTKKPKNHRSASIMHMPGPEQDDSFDFLFKIILIGDSNVGKTSVVRNFELGGFSGNLQNTIGVDFSVRTVKIEGKKVKIQVWDTAGQERFRTIIQSYYRSAHGAIIAYDITRQDTFDSVNHWITEVELYGASNVVLVLIGNKCDLEDKREVTFEEACNLAKNRGMLAALETSAMRSHNVEEAFMMMARELMARNGHNVPGHDSPGTNGTPRLLLRANSRQVVDLTGASASAERKTCC